MLPVTTPTESSYVPLSDQCAWPGIGVEQRVIHLVDEPGELRVVVRRSIRPPSSGPL
jgi:hypothetical protein